MKLSEMREEPKTCMGAMMARTGAAAMAAATKGRSRTFESGKEKGRRARWSGKEKRVAMKMQEGFLGQTSKPKTKVWQPETVGKFTKGSPGTAGVKANPYDPVGKSTVRRDPTGKPMS